MAEHGAEQHHYRNHSGDLRSFTIWKEGNMFMALDGPNIQEGICEFGETPELAAANFRSKHEQQ